MSQYDKSKMPQEEKILIAAMSALAAQDPKILAMALLMSLHKAMPPEHMEGKPPGFIKAQCCLAAMGFVQSLVEKMKRDTEKRAKAQAATAEVKDEAFSEEDKAKAAEILSAFMARSGVHLKEDTPK